MLFYAFFTFQRLKAIQLWIQICLILINFRNWVLKTFCTTGIANKPLALANKPWEEVSLKITKFHKISENG